MHSLDITQPYLNKCQTTLPCDLIGNALNERTHYMGCFLKTFVRTNQIPKIDLRIIKYNYLFFSRYASLSFFTTPSMAAGL